MYGLFSGRMCLPNIDFLKMQAFFINRPDNAALRLEMRPETSDFQNRFQSFGHSLSSS